MADPLRHPLTGRNLTEAEAAVVAVRATEASQVWAEVVSYARDAHSRLADPRERYMAIGVYIAEQIAAKAASTAPPGADPDGFTAGLMIGIVAAGAHDVAARTWPVNGHG